MNLKINKATVADADTISIFFMQISEENVAINNHFFENEGNIMLIAFSEDKAR